MVNVLLLFLAVIIFLRCLLDIRSNQWLHSSKNHVVVKYSSLHRTSFTTYLNLDAIALLKKFRALESFIFSKCDGEIGCLGKLWSELQVKAVLEGSKMFDCGDGHLQELKLLAVTTLWTCAAYILSNCHSRYTAMAQLILFYNLLYSLLFKAS